MFYHPIRKIRCVVHGEDFAFLGSDEHLDYCTKLMSDEYDAKIGGKLTRVQG